MNPVQFRALVLLMLFALSHVTASATTWGPPSSRADPVRDNAKCLVSEPASSGSYIYQWPSKYDQVFWPLTDPHGIWFCPESGFTAFLGDFELSAEEKVALSAHLAQVYQKKVGGPPDIRDLLELLKQSYSKREKSREFRIQLLRVLAYYNDAELHDYDASGRLRREALAMIQEDLRTNLEEAQKLEYLFVAAAYSRELGEIENSDRLLQELDSALSSTSDNLKGYAEYLSSLKKDVAQIVPGGELAPETPRN